MIQHKSTSSIRTIFIATVSLISTIYGHPLQYTTNTDAPETHEEPQIDYGSPEFYEKLVIIMALVLLGGVFAGKKKIFFFF